MPISKRISLYFFSGTVLWILCYCTPNCFIITHPWVSELMSLPPVPLGPAQGSPILLCFRHDLCWNIQYLMSTSFIRRDGQSGLCSVHCTYASDVRLFCALLKPPCCAAFSILLHSIHALPLDWLFPQSWRCSLLHWGSLASCPHAWRPVSG